MLVHCALAAHGEEAHGPVATVGSLKLDQIFQKKVMQQSTIGEEHILNCNSRGYIHYISVNRQYSSLPVPALQ